MRGQTKRTELEKIILRCSKVAVSYILYTARSKRKNISTEMARYALLEAYLHRYDITNIETMFGMVEFFFVVVHHSMMDHHINSTIPNIVSTNGWVCLFLLMDADVRT